MKIIDFSGVFICVFLQVTLSSQFLPRFQAMVENLTARLEPHQYLRNRGVYTDLSVHLLGQELTQLEADVGDVHSQLNNTQTRKLSKEVSIFYRFYDINHIFK